MAPVPKKGSKTPSNAAKARKSATAGPSSSSKSKLKRPPPKQVKSKPGSQTAFQPKKKKARVYTDKELNLPTMNMITPVGVTKPRGKKKGKIFVDDQESMMTILAMVNAEKEGQIESKLIKARAMEEIREARKAEAEKRHDGKKQKMEEVKKGLKKRSKSKDMVGHIPAQEPSERKPLRKSLKKRVSFA